MHALLDRLTSSRGITHLTLEVEETRARILRDLCLDGLATLAAHILLHILLVETVDNGCLVSPLQQNVTL